MTSIQLLTITSMSASCDSKIRWPVIDLAQKSSSLICPGDRAPAPPTLDLLAHRHRPDSVDTFSCHRLQAQRLREWIRDFTSASRNRSWDEPIRRSNGTRGADYDDSSSLSDASDTPEVARKCVLLTGPPGVGKTSMVYSVARELNMHVIESHSSERRDFKLFSTLKLANQKGKINPIARLFQVAQQKQAVTSGDLETKNQQRSAKRKRRKLEPEAPMKQGENGNSRVNNNQQLSLSGDSSVVLFDDIDVVFEEDGPFLKSLVEFIRESKRPVILTATQSVDFLKDTLVHFEHIHLDAPQIEDCAKLLQEVCIRENHNSLASATNCHIIARKSNGDLRQCFNRIHFYGEQAANETPDDLSDRPNVTPDISRLSYLMKTFDDCVPLSPRQADSQKTLVATTSQPTDDEATIIYNEASPRLTNPLDSYDASSVVDLMDCALNLVDRSTLLQRWLNGVPSHRHEESTSEHQLGERIRDSIVELTRNLYGPDIMSGGELLRHQYDFGLARAKAQEMSQRINLRIKGRIEPPEKDFYTDIVPMLGATIKLEANRKRQCASNKTGNRCYSPTINGQPRSPVTGSGTILSRRTRRVQSYLDLIGVYFEPEEFVIVEDAFLTPSSLGPHDDENEVETNDLLAE